MKNHFFLKFTVGPANTVQFYKNLVFSVAFQYLHPCCLLICWAGRVVSFISFQLLMMIPFRLIERARRTVRGSADDIGWMKRASGMPPVEDGTERFMEILDNIRYMSISFSTLICYYSSFFSQ